MKSFILLFVLIPFTGSAAFADVYKEVKSATDAIDADYEGSAPASSVYCQKGKESVEFFVYRFSNAGCQLTRSKKVCTKLIEPTGSDGEIHCGPGKWKVTQKRKAILKNKAEAACSQKLDQLTAQLKKHGYSCENGNFQ